MSNSATLPTDASTLIFNNQTNLSHFLIFNGKKINIDQIYFVTEGDMFDGCDVVYTRGVPVIVPLVESLILKTVQYVHIHPVPYGCPCLL
jgi:hypothetical protein